MIYALIFLSPPSARRATTSTASARRCIGHFYPRPPRGGRQKSICSLLSHCQFLSPPSARRATGSAVCSQRPRMISIPALREEGDWMHSHCLYGLKNFYPRPPRGGRLMDKMTIYEQCRISIPALREEGDLRTNTQAVEQRDFYPRPPRGGRQRAQHGRPWTRRFLSPPSARRATCPGKALLFLRTISIPALREEGDSAG